LTKGQIEKIKEYLSMNEKVPYMLNNQAVSHLVRNIGSSDAVIVGAVKSKLAEMTFRNRG
jgi:hypothetical protein